ncbi:hypothetical protein VNO77_39363 [Canavalia gladiata]|uniref:Uncharacterized protein n=1 Tax=Canavalia gladiata TaxID=3824 RepID=A0AAN9PX26_CANGL
MEKTKREDPTKSSHGNAKNKHPSSSADIFHRLAIPHFRDHTSPYKSPSQILPRGPFRRKDADICYKKAPHVDHDPRDFDPLIRSKRFSFSSFRFASSQPSLD